MVFNFGDYICVPNEDKGPDYDYRFNKDTFDKLIIEEEYDEAVAYAKQFTFTDAKAQQSYYNDVLNFQREAEINKAIYGNTNETDLAAVKFANSVFVNGGLDAFPEGKNEYKDMWVETVEQMGSEVTSNGTITNQATSLRFDFDNGKRTMLGMDWGNKDSQVTLDKFLATTGLDIEQLRQTGVRISQKVDGTGSITFSKANPFANQLLIELRNFADTNSQYFARDVMNITGIDENGKDIRTDDYFSKRGSILEHITPVGYMTYSINDGDRLDSLNSLVNGANNIKEKTINNAKPEVIQYSSTIGGPLSDSLYSLDVLLVQNKIDEDEYYRRRKLLTDNLDEMFAAVSVNEQVYTDFANDDETVKTLNLVDQKDRIAALEEAKAADAKNRHYNAGMVEGIRGVFVTIDPLKDENGKIKKKGFTMFIPNLWNDLTQSKINQDTEIRARQEINDIQNYNYAFVSYNGDKIKPKGDGNFIYENAKYGTLQTITFDEALTEINKSYMLEDLFNNDTSYYNTKGNIIDDTKFYNDAQAKAITFAQELYPNIELPIMDENGVPTTKNVFDIINKGNDYMLDNLSKPEYIKYKTIAEIFNAIIMHKLEIDRPNN